MKLRNLRIVNFRNLVDIEMPIADTTVLIGPNNAGKTAVLDALYIVLTRIRPGRESPFQQYDFHLPTEESSPTESAGIEIELLFREDSVGEWPDEIVQALTQIIQTDENSELHQIRLQVTSRYDTELQGFQVGFAFLNLHGEELRGEGGRPDNIRRFTDHLKLFRLSAVRNPDQEFSVNSQFWGRIIRDMKISPELEQELKRDLDSLNERVLKADERLGSVIDALQNINAIMESGIGGNTSIQALPTRPWELLNRSAVVVRGAGADVNLPLSRHGQGVQSLAVIFLFEAYINVFMNANTDQKMYGLLTFEEPEAHLHPHAIRELAPNLDAIESQKLISTHSPYMVQNIPITALRMMRRSGRSASVSYVKQVFSVSLASNASLVAYCTARSNKFSYDDTHKLLSVSGRMTDGEYRDLLQCFPGDGSAHAAIKQLQNESTLYITPAELDELQMYLRTRGDVLFARTWLLCEGHCEYLFLRACAQYLGKSLDRLGISVIDFQNNGSPGAFVRLARTLRIPWIGFSDDDAQRANFVNNVKSAGLSDAAVTSDFPALPVKGADLEEYLATTALLSEYEAYLSAHGEQLPPPDGQYQTNIARMIKKDKTAAMIALANSLSKSAAAPPGPIPQFFIDLINSAEARSRAAE